MTSVDTTLLENVNSAYSLTTRVLCVMVMQVVASYYFGIGNHRFTYFIIILTLQRSTLSVFFANLVIGLAECTVMFKATVLHIVSHLLSL